MNALLQRIEIEPVGGCHHDLAVEDAALGQQGAQGLLEFGKVAVQRLQVAALQEHALAGAEDDCPKAVPLGLEQESGFVGHRVGKLGKHRCNRGSGQCGVGGHSINLA
jgi:hypothetical protein